VSGGSKLPEIPFSRNLPSVHITAFSPNFYAAIGISLGLVKLIVTNPDFWTTQMQQDRGTPIGEPRPPCLCRGQYDANSRNGQLVPGPAQG
jgi:hypothetical protein